ncbi:MAG: spore cortex biosynthesis protein YabQ [Ruminococcus sp.]|nr:spore cortex biosynthesis protein YabQ [Ruminococcus sp.]
MNVPETFFSVREELVLFAASCIMGAGFGVVYDVFRTIRAVLRHNMAAVIIEDIIFFALYCVALSAFAVGAARGELRAYFAIGNIIGFTMYILLIGNRLIGCIRSAAGIIKKVVMTVLSPFRRLGVFLSVKTKVKFVGYSKNIDNSFKKIKILLLKRGRMMYNKKVNKMRKNVNKGGKKVKTE